MKKLIAAVLSVILIVCFSFPAEAAGASYNITVKFVSVKKVSNEHVGSKWAHIVTTGASTLKAGKSVKVVKTDADTLSFDCQSTEKDKSPDIGNAPTSVTVSSLKMGTTTYTVNVTVEENKGRYKGCKAVWKYTVTVTKKNKILRHICQAGR